jgi:hypothetical protein
MLIEKFEKAPCIWVYKDAFDSKDFVQKLEEEAQKSWAYLSWQQSSTGDGHRTAISEYRSSVEISLNAFYNDEIVDDLIDMKTQWTEDIYPKIDECVWDYRRAFDLDLRSDSGLTILKYIAGGEYHIHHDHSPENARVLSMVASLGAADEGGELEFNNFDLTIKLEKNSLVLFPSNYPYTHIAHPVIKGTKYSLVTWYM